MAIEAENLRLVVQVEGGIIQDICSNLPAPIQIYIIDYDTEGADMDELMTTPDGDEFVGHLGEARCGEAYVNSIFNSLPVHATEFTILPTLSTTG
jgi:hypothetical protein